jgi:hypothetical protein
MRSEPPGASAATVSSLLPKMAFLMPQAKPPPCVMCHSPTDCGISLRFRSLLFVLEMLLGVLAREIWIDFLALGLLFHELRLESAVH